MFAKTKKGTTLIEVIIALAIFAGSVLTLYQVYILATSQVLNAKQRSIATALANERIEHIRNIPYDEIGTTDSAPIGLIVPDEIITQGNTEYRIIINISFVDDEYDGTLPADTLFQDYKKVMVAVVWGPPTDSAISAADAAYNPNYSANRVAVTSQFVPPGGLETEVSGGILSLNILDSEGNPLPHVVVRIEDIDNGNVTSDTTDVTGNYSYVGARACDSCFQITISKSDYETITSTIKRDGVTQLYDPIYVNQSVQEGDITAATFVTEKASDFTVITENPLGEILPDIEFDFRGGRILGTDPQNGNAPVYVLDASFSTDTNGEVIVQTDINASGSIESGEKASSATYAADFSHPDYTFWKLDPGDDISPQETLLLPNTDSIVKLILLDNNEPSLFVQILDEAGTPFEGVEVTLKNDTLLYDEVATTDIYGYVYFPRNVSTPLIDGTDYVLTSSIVDYDDANETITIDKLTTTVLNLTPTP